MIATIRQLNLANLLNVCMQSLNRWILNHHEGLPPHVFSNHHPRGRHYTLPVAVTRLRNARTRGLANMELARVVAYDSRVRAELDRDDLYLGEHADQIVDKFIACLDPDETDRLKAVQRAVTNIALIEGLPEITCLRKIVAILPGVARYILVGENDELPVGDAGRTSYLRAVAVVNVPSHTLQKKAA